MNKERDIITPEVRHLKALGKVATFCLMGAVAYAILPDFIPGPIDDTCFLLASTLFKTGIDLLDRYYKMKGGNS